MERVWTIVKKAARRYFLDAMSAMAFGLFSSLIIGLIISQLSLLPYMDWLKPFAEVIGAKSPVVGSAIGVAVAYGLKSKNLAMFSSAATGALGYNLGGPVGAFVAAVVGAELGNLVSGKTRVDIIIVPVVTIVSGGLTAQFVGPGVSALMTGIGTFINNATQLLPLPMSIVVATSMGMALTLPISSAAIAISLNLSGLAAGAATAGCAAQMVGFAVASFRENGVSGLIAQGVGTSMLQVPNIFKKPVIWLAPTLASAIVGPVSAVAFKMTSTAVGAGMGTSGLVGQVAMWQDMQGSVSTFPLLCMIVFTHILLPALLTLLFNELFRKIGWVKDGDMQLSL